MSQFMDPSVVQTNSKTLTMREVTRALRQAIAAEEEAIHLYEFIVDLAPNEIVKKVMQDIANEEKVHVGEILAVLNKLLPNEEGFVQEGMNEIEEIKMARKLLAFREGLLEQNEREFLYETEKITGYHIKKTKFNIKGDKEIMTLSLPERDIIVTLEADKEYLTVEMIPNKGAKTFKRDDKLKPGEVSDGKKLVNVYSVLLRKMDERYNLWYDDIQEEALLEEAKKDSYKDAHSYLENLAKELSKLDGLDSSWQVSDLNSRLEGNIFLYLNLQYKEWQKGNNDYQGYVPEVSLKKLRSQIKKIVDKKVYEKNYGDDIVLEFDPVVEEIFSPKVKRKQDREFGYTEVNYGNRMEIGVAFVVTRKL